MHEAVVSPLVAWQGFCTLIGSAAATLTGLMFVVVTLVANTTREGERRSEAGIGAFGTPSVVHFCIALLIAATLSMPWPIYWLASLPCGLAGLGGIVYMCIVLRRTRRQREYQPVLEDWVWHLVLPMLSYTMLSVAAPLLLAIPTPALFGVAASTVLFLLIGIHNAWDTVTYQTIQQARTNARSQGQEECLPL